MAVAYDRFDAPGAPVATGIKSMVGYRLTELSVSTPTSTVAGASLPCARGALQSLGIPGRCLAARR